MEENKRKQYAHLYEHHEVEDPQPREEKEKPIGPSGRNPPRAGGGEAGGAHRLFFPGHGGCFVTCIELFSDQRGKKGSGFGIYPQRKAANEKS